MYLKFLLILFILAAGIHSPAQAQEKPAAAPLKVDMLDDAAISKIEKSSEPSSQHQLLSTLKGSWYYEIQYWSKGGADPQVSTGTVKNDMVLGGRFLLSKTSLILNVGGQNIPYEAWSLLGYDTASQAFTSVWADTMHTNLATGSGTFNESSNTIEEKGSFTNPLTGKKLNYRSELQFIDGGAHKRTFFIPNAAGKEFKVIEITFERRQ